MSSGPELVKEAAVIDPVCGMSILPSRAAGHVEHEGRTYYFCSASCMERFQQTPDTFLGRERASHEKRVDAPVHTAPDKREYTCPMDPEVRRTGPGACPKCGMALEPVIARTGRCAPSGPARCTRRSSATSPGRCPICGMALEPRTVTLEEANPELDDMTRRFWRVGGAHGAAPRVHGCRSSCPVSLCSSTVPPAWLTWITVRARHAGGSLGRLAVLRARLGLDRQPAPEHVHADRPGRRAPRTASASSRRWRRDCFRPPSGRTAGRSACTSSPPPSSSLWCCSDRCSSSGRAAGRGAQSGSCSASRRRRRAASMRTGARRMFRSNRCRSGTGFACVPGEGCRSDGVVAGRSHERGRVDDDRRADPG